jgi:class 3 adenylate cyclase
MHRMLRQLLSHARGESRLAVVVFVDVRGFSSFARLAESSEAALFLRSAYVQILDEYFPEASFFKPTGDGLLIVLDYDDDTLRTVVRGAVKQSVALVRKFPKITQGDPMVNFAVPQHVGVGLARGAATALVSEDSVLDYSGRPLNLAARLMDLARPEGVVFSDGLGVGLLTPSQQKQFKKSSVYVKGIAEDEPLTCYALNELVRIPEHNLYPLNKYVWKTLRKETRTFKVLSERGTYLHRLPEEPAQKNDLRVHVEYPKVTASGRRVTENLLTNRRYSAEYIERAGERFARVNYGPILKALTDAHVKSTWEVGITIEYAVRP